MQMKAPDDAKLSQSAAEGDSLRFLCDDMLLGLGRWLRAAGYDTEVADGGSLSRQATTAALSDGRLLLTRDRSLVERYAGEGRVLLLSGNDLAAWARELAHTLGLDWTFRPFSRCLSCNEALEAATAERCTQLPPALRGIPDVRYCGRCDKLFWEGSHLRLMHQRLREWRSRYAQVRSGLADTLSAGVVFNQPDQDGTGTE